MAYQVVILRLSFLLAAVLMGISPIAAQGLTLSPHSINLEMMPGTSARVMLTLQNGLEHTYSFQFSPQYPSRLREGYTSCPDISWFSVQPAHLSLAPGEQGWVSLEVAIPDDKGLVGQRWQTDIRVSCGEEPLLRSEVTVLVEVGEAPSRVVNWVVGGGTLVFSLAGVILWGRHRKRERDTWATGLKRRHWID